MCLVCRILGDDNEAWNKEEMPFECQSIMEVVCYSENHNLAIKMKNPPLTQNELGKNFLEMSQTMILLIISHAIISCSGPWALDCLIV